MGSTGLWANYHLQIRQHDGWSVLRLVGVREVEVEERKELIDVKLV
jgi:hypothetical protein